MNNQPKENGQQWKKIKYELPIFQKYFKGIPPMALIYKLEELQEIRKSDLEELLSEYGLINHFPFFEEISKWLPAFKDSTSYTKEYLNKIKSYQKEEISLIQFSESLKKKQIKGCEIKFNLKGRKLKENKGKISITNPDILEEIGEILYSSLVEKKIQQGIPKELINHKFGEEKGRPKSAYYQALFSFGLLNYLNNETELKSGNSFISNDQGKFIYDFLEYTNFLIIDSSKVLKEEYIRTMLINYKKTFSHLFPEWLGKDNN